MRYYYVVAFNNTILGVYGNALRELAFEKAAMHRSKGIDCEVYTRNGPRQSANSKFNNMKG